MSIVITGATGQLGGLVVEALLARGVEPDGIIAAGRNPDRLEDLSGLGVGVAPIDYDDTESLRVAFEGAERVLLISGSAIGQRLVQHRNVVAVAAESGVSELVYTSILRADTSSLLLAEDHRDTEEELGRSGVPFVLLRNGWYLENYTAQLPIYLQNGGIVGSAGAGRISAASRADYAAAAAAVLTSDGHAGAVYELGGDESFTMTQLAEEVSRQSGTAVGYQDLSIDAYTKVLVDAGLPPEVAAVLADGDRGVAEGELFVDSGDLRRLTGRPTTSLAEAIRAALR